MLKTIKSGLQVFCGIGLLLMILSTVACSSVTYRNPTIGIASAAAHAAIMPTETLQAQVPAKDDVGCEHEARVFAFVSTLPAISEVYQLDLYLARHNPQPNEPKYIGRCVLNPFNAQNIAAQQGAQ